MLPLWDLTVVGIPCPKNRQRPDSGPAGQQSLAVFHAQIVIRTLQQGSSLCAQNCFRRHLTAHGKGQSLI